MRASPSRMPPCWAWRCSGAGRCCWPSTSGTASPWTSATRCAAASRCGWISCLSRRSCSSRRAMAPAWANWPPPRSRAYDAAMRDMRTPQLTRVLEKALEAHQPPLVQGPAHQAALRPPGRPQPAAHRHPRQPDRSHARRVPALPVECVPRGLRPVRLPRGAGTAQGSQSLPASRAARSRCAQACGEEEGRSAECLPSCAAQEGGCRQAGRQAAALIGQRLLSTDSPQAWAWALPAGTAPDPPMRR